MRLVRLSLLLSLALLTGAAAQVPEREIETIALYMPNLRAEPGQRLKTRTSIGCFRNAPGDYRCMVIGLRMQGAVVMAKTVDTDAQAYLDRYCRGRRNGLDYIECRFQLAFDYVSESLDPAENLRVYRAENMVLTSDYLSGTRVPPRREQAPARAAASQ